MSQKLIGKPYPKIRKLERGFTKGIPALACYHSSPLGAAELARLGRSIFTRQRRAGKR